MPADLTALARELVASPAWRDRIQCPWCRSGWLEGMGATDGRGNRLRLDAAWASDGGPPEHWLPDLTDAATVGVLLEWLPLYSIAPVVGGGVAVSISGTTWAGSCLGEAVARALIAVGARRG